MKNNYKVVYILGSSRSGSSFLSSILSKKMCGIEIGEYKRLQNIGTLNKLNQKNCSCGAGLDKCCIWSTVQKKISLSQGKNKGFIFNVLNLMLLKLNIIDLNSSNFSFDIKNLIQGYSVINDVSKMNVIIDSSKSPLYLYYLGKFNNFDLEVIWLIRDPKKNAISLISNDKRRKQLNINSSHSHRKICNRAFLNLISNSMQSLFVFLLFRGKKKIVFYEDILKLEKMEPISDNGLSHCIGGSPSRSKIGFDQIVNPSTHDFDCRPNYILFLFSQLFYKIMSRYKKNPI